VSFSARANFATISARSAFVKAIRFLRDA